VATQEVMVSAPLLMAQVVDVVVPNMGASPTSRDAAPPTALPLDPSARFVPRLATPPKHVSTVMMMIPTLSHTRWV
jgi:hypothetical protein